MVFKRPQNNRGYIILTHIKLVETAVSPEGSSVHCLACVDSSSHGLVCNVFLFVCIAQITTEVSEAGSGGGPVACPQRSRDTINVLMSVFVYALCICCPRPLFCLMTLCYSYF